MKEIKWLKCKDVKKINLCLTVVAVQLITEIYLCSREKTYQQFYDHLYNEALGY